MKSIMPFSLKPGKVTVPGSTFLGDIYIRDGSGRGRGSGSLFDMFDDPFFGEVWPEEKGKP